MEFPDEERDRRAHYAYADSSDPSYASEEERKEEGQGGQSERYYNSASAFPPPGLEFSTYTNSNFLAFLDSLAPNFPVRSPPSPDVRVSVVGSSIEKPAFSATKGKVSMFSLSSLYDSGTYMKVIEASLRCAAAVLSLIVFCVMSSAREVRVGAGSTFDVQFSDFQAYNFLVASNVLSFVYSSAQVVAFLQSGSDDRGNSSSGSIILASPIRSGVCKYVCDEILAICLFSASSSAATASQMSHYGLRNIWPPACATWKLWKLCSKADTAVVISFFSSFSVVLSSLFSGLYVIRLIALA